MYSTITGVGLMMLKKLASFDSINKNYVDTPYMRARAERTKAAGNLTVEDKHVNEFLTG